MKKYLILSASALLFTGCIYPIYKTLQPQAMVEVVDENKVAIKNVNVHLQTRECLPCKNSEQVKLSNERGIVHFDSQREWRKEILIIHGSTSFTWSWCVEKEGYKTILTSEAQSDKFESHRTFILEKGNTLPCDSPYLVSEFKLKRFDDLRLKNRIHTLISEMLDPNKATNAYVKLEKLGKKAVPYIVLQMNDFRELPMKSITFDSKSTIKVTYVTDALSAILTQITNNQFTPNTVEINLKDKLYNIDRWRNFVRNWGLSENI